jgi:hypothetical protein
MLRTVSGSWSTCESTKLAPRISPFPKRDAQYSRSIAVRLRRPCTHAVEVRRSSVGSRHRRAGTRAGLVAHARQFSTELFNASANS